MSNKLENSSAVYSEDLRNREKSVEEIAKFILDHLGSSPDFLSFLRNQELASRQGASAGVNVWTVFCQKPKKGWVIVLIIAILFLAARRLILQRREAGELPEFGAYLDFCDLSDEDFKIDL